jgi:putative ABC transport system ATP-binding protein
VNQGTTVVEISKLKFAYGKALASPHWTLDIPEVKIQSGEHTFIYGPSGSGKTTLLGLLSGILQPQVGRVSVLGKPLSQMQSRERDRFRGNHLGYIFQMFNLLPYLSVKQNILLPIQMSKVRLSRLQKSPTEEILELARGLRIEALLDKPVTEISVGQQQRVAAARALMGRPEIVIADEPTSALDFDHREEFLKTMFRQAEKAGSTVLFVSHDQTLRPLFAKTISLPEVNLAHKATAVLGANEV